MSAAWAKPGVKCVCIDDRPLDRRPFEVVRGRIYTVLEVANGGVTLAETKDRSRYWVWRFRPIVTRTQEQDVAIFRPLLNTICEDA